MQNRCARIVSKNFDFNISSKTLLKQLGWMDIYTRFQYFIGILRDGPFDTQGGWDFSSQQVIFFTSKLQQVFYILKK